MKNMLIDNSLKLLRRISLLSILLFGALSMSSTNIKIAQETYVNLNAKNKTIKNVLSEIESKTGFVFFYFDDDVELNEEISIVVKNEPIDKILGDVFKNTDYSYKISERQVFVTKSQKAPVDNKRTITGVVLDEINEPVIGASVLIEGTSRGTTTDIDGKFTLNVTTGDKLFINYIGYKKTIIKVDDNSSYKIKLSQDQQLLDEVVVIGFQSQKKVNLTSAITTVGQETFENRPVTSIGQALQGLVPNLNIKIESGSPDVVPQFNIRGGTTLRKKSGEDKYEVVNGSPLILVDGVEVGNDILNQLNPNDIASMSVLKDASAAAIYGTRATFGVILVQTKSGNFNTKAKVTYSYDIMLDRIAHKPDILNYYTISKAELDRRLWTTGEPITEKEQIKLDHMLAYMNDPYNNKPWYSETNDPNPLKNSPIWVGNQNPYRDAIRNVSPTQRHNVSIAGGGDKISYSISLGAQTQDGMLKIREDQVRRYTMMSAVNAKVTDWFSIAARTSFNIRRTNAPTGKPGVANLWTSIKNENPIHHLAKPIFTGPDDPVPNAPTENILSYYYAGGVKKASREVGIYSISPEFTIIPNELKVKADLSYTPETHEYKETAPASGRIETSWESPQYYGSQYNMGYVKNTKTNKYAVNVYADYSKSFFEKHNLSALLGVNQERLTYSFSELTLKRLYDPHILNPNNVEDVALNTSSTNAHEWTARAMFGRLLYDFEGKYLFEFDVRYDGSSRFPKNNRFQTFPTFSLAWRISQESFMDWSKSWLDDFKVRGSWGKLGSQPDGVYSYQRTYASASSDYTFDASKMPSTVKVPALINPYLTWETATTTNIGVDFTLLKNKLFGDFNYFNRTTKDILIPGGTEYPAFLGADAPLENTGKMSSKGWELNIQWRDRLSMGLEYNVGFILSDAKTKIKSFAGNESKLLSQLYSGMYDAEIWGYETGGILQEEDFEISYDAKGNKKYEYLGAKVNGNENLYPGYIWYKDLNGDGVINGGNDTYDDPGDRKVIGNSTPRYKYAITAGASYKGFDLAMMFNGVGKRDVWLDSSSSYWGSSSGSWGTYNNSWTPERTNAKFPMYGVNIGGRPQTGYLLNGAYLRMKELSIGYTLPKLLVSKAGLEKLRISASAYNLFTISDLPKYVNPEQTLDDYPEVQTFSFGVQVTF